MLGLNLGQEIPVLQGLLVFSEQKSTKVGRAELPGVVQDSIKIVFLSVCEDVIWKQFVEKLVLSGALDTGLSRVLGFVSRLGWLAVLHHLLAAPRRVGG